MPTYINTAGSKYGISQTQFNASGKWAGCYVVRANNAATAAIIARTVNAAIANPNIKYSQSSRDSVYKNGVNYGGTTYADCSSLVSYAVRQGTGNSTFNTATGNGKSMVDNLMATGYFGYETYVEGQTDLHVGDILIYRNGGHTAVVVDGTARTGLPSELLSAEGGFGNEEYAMDFSSFEGEGEFEPRFEEPIIEPVEENLPEELIELIELGEVSKEELEEDYDMYYIYEGRGGYSPFGDVPLTNTSYAYNRFAEIMGCQDCCPLPKGSPGSWVAAGGGGCVCDMAPELGAAMCFSNQAGGEGYACIIEAFLSDEVILTSQVENGSFTLKERYKRYGAWDFDTYMCTGFIHNPGAYMGATSETALETFLNIAEENVGQGQGWVVGETGIIGPNGWSAAFIVACSKRAGSSLNIVIPNVDSVSTIGRVGVLRGMGTWHKGAIYGGGYEPSAGDIVVFRYSGTKKTENIYKGDKAGIVVESDGGSFRAIVGDDGGTVSNKHYSTGTPFIAGYFSPNWESIDGTTASKKEYRNIQGLYTNGVTKYDASARTVGYVSSDYKPSISPSHIKLAAVNYTGMLANMYSVFGQAGISTATNAELVVDYWTNTIRSYYQINPGDFAQVDGSVLNMTGLMASGIFSPTEGGSWYGNFTESASVSVTATVDQVYEFLKGKGLSSAAAVGVLANLQAESGFRTGAIGDKGTSAGLAQWHAGRMTAMKEYVGSNWATNVSGQLDFLWHELQTSYKGVLNKIKSVPDTAEGARQATSIWIHDYEVPAGYNDPNSQVYKTRQEYSNGFYEKIGR